MQTKNITDWSKGTEEGLGSVVHQNIQKNPYEIKEIWFVATTL